MAHIAIEPDVSGRAAVVSTVSETARAKVNLSLQVLGKRDDGYHELDSIVAFAEFGDEVLFDPRGEPGFSIAGPFATALDGPNLIETAADALRAWFGKALPGRFTLTKRIPVAAGLGGGSADAAAAIRAMARAYELAVEATPEFHAYLAKIGADVPVCLSQAPSRMTGIGEIVTILPRFIEMPVVLVNPGVPLSTREVFAALGARHFQQSDAPATTAPAWTDADAAIEDLLQRHNHLEAPAMQLRPVIAEVLAALRSQPLCRLARLSGSGPTCFGVFASPAQAEDAAARIANGNQRWWVQATALR